MNLTTLEFFMLQRSPDTIEEIPAPSPTPPDPLQLKKFRLLVLLPQIPSLPKVCNVNNIWALQFLL